MKNIIVTTALIISISITGFAQQGHKLAAQIMADKQLDTVYTKATALLSKGFNAGDGYPQVWIRDFNTFIETSCKVYSRDSIRTNLLTFIRLQQPNGEIVDGYVLKGHVTWNDPNIYTSPNDKSHVGFKNTVETDQETSLIQAIAKYIRVTGDKSILQETIAGKTALQHLEISISYLLKNRYSKKYHLLTGATTQDWGDVQIEGGAVVDVDENTHWAIDIYDNAMFVIALNDMAGFYKTGTERQKWLQLKTTTISSIRKHLWDAKKHKFIPHLYLDKSPFPASFDENKIYFHGGTAVAIEAGILSKNEIRLVNQDMLRNVKLSGAPSIGLTLYPIYPEGIYKNSSSSKPFIYQNGGDWTWFGARMIQQLIRYGFVKEAYEELQPMINRTIKDNGFYEWYGVDGKPNGSAAFKGSAGVLAKAIDQLKEWAKNN
ncbi:Amylo-alpha-1,6-glucosidase [Mucilaginibacter mallensis]|uniref:Amylo-alpha-1,6-glucosidase n=2 Tax=Mucilaginibacter mallensis TaxID=652787 RepID=A0A1H1RHF9_MUCMA|nr:Amylo-alpha-1,6-glucosidase [Mucilaginibacter mallensis]